MSLAEFDVTGQKVLVVGAGRGIGKGIALAFAEAGADVAIASLTEAFQGGRAVGPHLLERGQGSVINISGWASFRGRPGYSAYDAARLG